MQTTLYGIAVGDYEGESMTDLLYLTVEQAEGAAQKEAEEYIKNEWEEDELTLNIRIFEGLKTFDVESIDEGETVVFYAIRKFTVVVE